MDFECTKCLMLYNAVKPNSFRVYEQIDHNRYVALDFCSVNCLTLWYIDGRNDGILWSNEPDQ